MKNLIRIMLIIFLSFSYATAQDNIQTNLIWHTLSKSPWPISHGNQQSNGRTTVIGPKAPNVIWKVNKPSGISQGLVIGSNNTLYFGSDWNRYFYAMATDTTVKWVYDGGIINFATFPILVDNQENIYFGSRNGLFYKLNKDGNLVWTYSMAGSYANQSINIGLDSVLYFTSVDKNLYALKSSGILKWKLNIESGFSTRSPVLSPDGQTIYICGKDSNLYALNLDSSLKWKFKSAATDAIPLVDSQGNIYIIPRDNETKLYSLKPDGNIRWIYSGFGQFTSSYQSSPTMDINGNIYFTCSDLASYQDVLVSVDYYGNFRWQKILDEQNVGIAHPLASDAEGKIYFGSTYGNNYYCFSSDGTLVWKMALNGRQVDSAPAFGNDGSLYIGVHKGDSKISLIAINDKISDVKKYDSFSNDFSLSQNYPNPFNSVTTISFSIPEESNVLIRVYNILGQELETIFDGKVLPGKHNTIWDGSKYASGLYIITLKTNSGIRTLKVMLAK